MIIAFPAFRASLYAHRAANAGGGLCRRLLGLLDGRLRHFEMKGELLALERRHGDDAVERHKHVEDLVGLTEAGLKGELGVRNGKPVHGLVREVEDDAAVAHVFLRYAAGMIHRHHDVYISGQSFFVLLCWS